ncbi:uncharacterized protein Dvar_24360 [Desulfosarcina variabilis str. Montpellier]|uniref:hypothetical protein n=1 Tax=Desulfosarcina variabilis TaxID=2300 RepID=UPI003AFA7AB8
MKLLKHRFQIIIGLWVLAGLMVAGINGYLLLSLLDQPLAGYSPGARQVRRQFQQYQRLLESETEKISSGMQLLAERFASRTPDTDSAVAIHEKEKSAVNVEKKVNRPTVVLPVLAGIVTRHTPVGRLQRIALLNNGIFSEGEMLQEFTIRKISADGVLLAKGKKTWFLKRPEIAYSLSQQ